MPRKKKTRQKTTRTSNSRIRRTKEEIAAGFPVELKKKGVKFEDWLKEQEDTYTPPGEEGGAAMPSSSIYISERDKLELEYEETFRKITELMAKLSRLAFELTKMQNGL